MYVSFLSVWKGYVGRSLSGEEGPDGLLPRLDAALDEGGLTAAPTGEGSVQLLDQGPQVAAGLADGVLVGPVRPGEDGAAAAAPGLDRVAQPPQGVGGHIPLHQQHVPGAVVPLLLSGEIPLLQGRHPGPDGLRLPAEPLHGGGGIGGLGGEEVGDLGVLLQNGGAVGRRPGPRRHLDTDPVPELLAGEELYQPHLAAPADVGAAAGAAVRAGPGDDPHRALQGLLAAVRQGGQGFAVGPAGLHRVVLPDVLVGQGLDLRHVLRRQGGVEVDGHQVPADVEAHVVAVVPGAEDAADDVLPAVLLHEVEAAGEVDLSRYRLPYRQRAGAQVDHLPLLLVGVSDRYAAKGDRVIIYATPDKGYELDTLKVYDAWGDRVDVYAYGNNYAFTMPRSAVKVVATFTDAKYGHFTDVPKDSWYYDAVYYVYNHDIMDGIGNRTFNPYGDLSRAMIVTTLYRLEGEPGVRTSGSFRDVPDNTWYSSAVEWAAKEGIVKGYGKKTFKPSESVTVEQLAAILQRYADYKGYDIDETVRLYADAVVSQWAVNNVRWAAAEGLLRDGRSTNGTLVATRAEIAYALYGFMVNVAK